MDVDNLEAGRELDELVVEVMGWRISSWVDETDGGYNLFDVNGNYKAKWDAPERFKHELDPRHRWSPSIDIKAAWQVVEWLVDKGYCPGLLYDDNGHWALALEGMQDVPIGPDPQDIATSFFVDSIMWADTAPLAICKAALKELKD